MYYWQCGERKKPCSLRGFYLKWRVANCQVSKCQLLAFFIKNFLHILQETTKDLHAELQQDINGKPVSSWWKCQGFLCLKLNIQLDIHCWMSWSTILQQNTWFPNILAYKNFWKKKTISTSSCCISIHSQKQKYKNSIRHGYTSWDLKSQLFWVCSINYQQVKAPKTQLLSPLIPLFILT